MLKPTNDEYRSETRGVMAYCDQTGARLIMSRKQYILDVADGYDYRYWSRFKVQSDQIIGRAQKSLDKIINKAGAVDQINEHIKSRIKKYVAFKEDVDSQRKWPEWHARETAWKLFQLEQDLGVTIQEDGPRYVVFRHGEQWYEEDTIDHKKGKGTSDDE